MKKVKYNGQNEVLIPTHGLIVNNGDVIEVEDDFNNAQFEEIKEKASKKDGEVNE
jgi:hypothetical protein